MPQRALPRSVKSAVQHLLKYFSPRERSIPGSSEFGNSRIESALDALNNAFSEIQVLGPAWVYRLDQGIRVNAPVASTGTFTDGSPTFTPAPATWADWMIGCAIKISGSDADNRIIGYDPVSLTATLRESYVGAGGSVTNTVYHDSLLLPDDCAEIMQPVFSKLGELLEQPGFGRARWNSSDNRLSEDYGADRKRIFRTGARDDILAAEVGDPRFYWVQNWWTPSHEQQKRLFLHPYPGASDQLLYSCKLEVPQYVVTDVLHSSDGPVPMTAQAGDIATAPIATATGQTSLDAYPLTSFGSNAPQSESFPINTTPPAERKIELDVSGLGAPLVTGAEYLMWYNLRGTNVAQVEQFTARDDVSSDLDGKWFQLFDEDGSIGVWIDVGDTGTTIPAGAALQDRAIEVTGVVEDDNQTAVAAAIADALEADSKFSCSNAGADVVITHLTTGAVSNAADGDTGFTDYLVTTEGEGTPPTVCVEGTILKFPYDLVDSVLLRVASEHLRKSPWFRNDAVIPEIERGYGQALQILSSARPQNKTQVRMTAKY